MTTRLSATVSVQLLTLCADDTVVDVDTGTVHDAYVRQLEGGAAQVNVIPCPGATSSPSNT